MNPLDKRAQDNLGGMVLLQRVVVQQAPAPTLRLANISQHYKHLKIYLKGRDTATGSTDLACRVTVNGDTNSAHYENQYGYFGGATAGAAVSSPTAAGGFIAAIPGTSAQAGALGQYEITCLNYSDNNAFKILDSSGTEYSGNATHIFRYFLSVVWGINAPITDLTFTPTNGFVPLVSSVDLYGLR